MGRAHPAKMGSTKRRGTILEAFIIGLRGATFFIGKKAAADEAERGRIDVSCGA
jgi:hypothetical protein